MMDASYLEDNAADTPVHGECGGHACSTPVHGECGGHACSLPCPYTLHYLLLNIMENAADTPVLNHVFTCILIYLLTTHEECGGYAFSLPGSYHFLFKNSEDS